MGALIEQGDEILVPGPTYSPYLAYPKFFGGRPISYQTVEEDGWHPNIDDLRNKISKRTRAIVIVNPSNPCGSLFQERAVRQIVELAGQYDLPVISDEIYDRIVYEKGFVSTASLARDVSVVGLNGFSKAYLMTGWRLGYVYFHDPRGKLKEVKEGIEKEARIRVSANTPVQRAGIEALNGPQGHIAQLVRKLKQRRDYSWKRVNEIEGMTCTKPEAAFYLFPNIHALRDRWKTDLDFVLDLLRETGVLLVHGSGFDPVYGTEHVRAVFLPPIETLSEAFDELDRFMKIHK